ncbi:uncharacterized protein LOC128238378 [Mya arenaria]|uniref:uncharacterized protein LOC128238378 n=1 Tax=Mya arenaria TaxID=6604 RepID=UPI0022E991F0|nr:uncharacterized protein LOC128238378 [Mya arenaria]
MSSGISPNSDCSAKWDELMQKRLHSYIVYKISDDAKQIEVDRCGEKKSVKGKGGDDEATDFQDYDDMIEYIKSLGEKECRYIVFDCDFSNTKLNKVLFILWCPDTANIKNKMVYTASQKGLCEKLTGAKTMVQCNDFSDLAWKDLSEKATRFSTK